MIPSTEEPPRPIIRLSAVAVAIGFAGVSTLMLCTPWTRVPISSSGAPPSIIGALLAGAVPAIISGFLLWFAARADCPWHRRQMRSAIKWAMGMGALGFLIGFTAPLFTSSKKMLGPLLAFYITGPLGIPLGLAIRSLLPFVLLSNLPTYAPATPREELPWLPRCQLALVTAAITYLANIILECNTLRHNPNAIAPIELTLIPFVSIPNAALGFLAAWGLAAIRDLRSPTPKCGRLHNLLAVVLGVLAVTRFATLATGNLLLLRDAHRLPSVPSEEIDRYVRTHASLDHFRLALAADNPNASAPSLDTLAQASRKKLLASRHHLLPVLGKSSEARTGTPAIHLLLQHPNLSEASRTSLARIKNTAAP